MAIFQRRGGVSKKNHDITALDLGIMGRRHAAAGAGALQPAAEADLEAATLPKVAVEAGYPGLVDGPLTAIA